MSWLVTLTTRAGDYETTSGWTREGSIVVSGSGSIAITSSGVTDRGDGGGSSDGDLVHGVDGGGVSGAVTMAQVE